jgi:hypothetical protein
MVRSFPSSYFPAVKSARSMQTTKGVADYLRADDKMAALLPGVRRMAALQNDCTALLPNIFDTCAVVQFESGQLVLSVSNSALAAKLKQQLPKLQDALLKKGWQVNAIRLKLQPRKFEERPAKTKQLVLPTKAVSALAVLNNTLEDSPRNEALKAAIAAMVNRHRSTR